MESEEGLWEGPVQLGPSTRWDEGLHLASIFPPPPISTLPLPSLSLCTPWETRPEMAPRKTTYSLKALFGFPPKQDREEAHLPSCVRCSPLDQSTGPRGRDLPDQRGSCPIKAAYAGGGSCFQKDARVHDSCDSGRDSFGAYWLGNTTFRRSKASLPSLCRQLFSPFHVTFLQKFSSLIIL